MAEDTNWMNLAAAGVQGLGTLYAANRASGAQQNIANATNATTQQAADAAAFRPVGVTSRFGSSGFNYDPQGRLTGAGYQVSPDMAAQREALLGLSGGALSQVQQAQRLTDPSRQAATGLFNLGNTFIPQNGGYSASPEAGQYSNFLRNQAMMSAPSGFSSAPTAASQQYSGQLGGIASSALPTSFAGNASPEAQDYYNRMNATAQQVMPTSYNPMAAAQQYMQQQQGLLAPQREQDLANIRNNLQQSGRSGLATGATNAGGMGATNPEMAAYYNSIAQQNAQLGANSQQIARANLQSDIGLSSQLGQSGLGALTGSQQQATQNALQRGQFGAGLLSQGYGATNAAGQQNLSNSMNLGQFSSNQMGSALQNQQASDEIARQRMLSNISTGTGLFNQGLGLLNQGYGTQQAAMAPYSSYLGGAQTIEGMGQQALTTGMGLGSSAASAGSNQGQLLQYGQVQTNLASQKAAGFQNAATTGMLTGAMDPITQLIRGYNK